MTSGLPFPVRRGAQDGCPPSEKVKMQNTEYKYRLSTLAERKSLGQEWMICPQCGKREFSPYLDRSGRPVGRSCGRCNREINCGYHVKPKEYFAIHPDTREAEMPMAMVRVQPKLRIEMPIDWVVKSMARNGENVLLQYLRRQPWSEMQRARLENAIDSYGVGTDRQGRTIWWQIDDEQNVRSGKRMMYKADGHRDKKCAPTWIHSAPGVRAIYPSDKYEYVGCLFGQHLLAEHRRAKACLVESEKSALICSAFWPMEERVWVACGGLSHINAATIAPIVSGGREVLAYPDHDGYERWKDKLDGRINVSEFVERHYVEGVDPIGADMADVMLRMLGDATEGDEPMTNERLYERLKERYEQLRRFTECVEVRLKRPSEVIK